MKKLLILLIVTAILLTACGSPAVQVEVTQTSQTTSQKEQTEKTPEATQPPANKLDFPDAVASVSSGSNHTMAVDKDGNLWVWGDNYNGQIGDGNVSTYHDPIFEGDPNDYHTYLDEPVNGRRDRNVDNDVYTPKLIMKNVIFAVARDDSSFAVTKDNKLYAWGCNSYGKLGDGTGEQKTTPTFIMDDVRYVDSVNYNTLFIKTDNTLWAVRSPEFMIPDEEFEFHKPKKLAENVKKAVFDNTKPNTTGIAVLTTDGEVIGVDTEHGATYEIYYYSKDNDGRVMGQLSDFGYGIINNFSDIVDISSGAGQQIFLLDKKGDVFGWGANGSSGKLGIGVNSTGNDDENDLFWVDTAISITSGVAKLLNGCMFIKNDGALYVWGTNIEWASYKSSSGKVNGFGTIGDLIVFGPTPVLFLENIIMADGNIALDRDFKVYTWGQNFHGQLGTGDSENRTQPTLISFE